MLKLPSTSIEQIARVRGKKKLIATEDGKKAVNVALVANRKTKIGSNMMEIIVCGSIPPVQPIIRWKACEHSRM